MPDAGTRPCVGSLAQRGGRGKTGFVSRKQAEPAPRPSCCGASGEDGARLAAPGEVPRAEARKVLKG